MDVYQAAIVCSNCAHSNKVIITAEVSSAVCENCSECVVRLKRFDGVIYVMKSTKVQGVKIGMTQRDVFRRAKQVSGTGVPGDFEVLAAFPSNNVNRDERKIHEKLASKRIKKEHFDLDPVTAIVRVRSILNRRDWVFLSRKLVAKVEERLEAQKASVSAKLNGRQSAPKAPGATQKDLFEEVTDVGVPSPPARSKAKSEKKKGFLATLFPN